MGESIVHGLLPRPELEARWSDAIEKVGRRCLSMVYAHERQEGVSAVRGKVPVRGFNPGPVLLN